jgi:hypothetical protein
MNNPKIVSRDEWLVARAELLVKEKATTRARDRLNAARRQLPMVKMEKEYRSPVLLWRSLRTTRRARTGPFPGSPRLAANSTRSGKSPSSPSNSISDRAIFFIFAPPAAAQK